MIEQHSETSKKSNVVKVLHWGENPARIMCLIGSPRYQSEFLSVAKAFTLRGYVVLTPDVYLQNNTNGLTNDDVEILNEVSRKKIEMADVIFVVNPNNKVPETVYQELRYAKDLGREIRYLETPSDTKA